MNGVTAGKFAPELWELNLLNGLIPVITIVCAAAWAVQIGSWNRCHPQPRRPAWPGVILILAVGTLLGVAFPIIVAWLLSGR